MPFLSLAGLFFALFHYSFLGHVLLGFASWFSVGKRENKAVHFIPRPVYLCLFFTIFLTSGIVCFTIKLLRGQSGD